MVASRSHFARDLRRVCVRDNAWDHDWRPARAVCVRRPGPRSFHSCAERHPAHRTRPAFHHLVWHWRAVKDRSGRHAFVLSVFLRDAFWASQRRSGLYLDCTRDGRERTTDLPQSNSPRRIALDHHRDEGGRAVCARRRDRGRVHGGDGRASDSNPTLYGTVRYHRRSDRRFRAHGRGNPFQHRAQSPGILTYCDGARQAPLATAPTFNDSDKEIAS